MSFVDGVRARLRAVLRSGAEERDMDEEMRFHLEMEERKLVREGLDPATARRQARVRFGGVERMKERTREERGSRWMEETARDARLAVRSLARSPGFTVVAVLTLSLGIGATTAMFSLVRGVLLRPLPYPASERMVAVWERARDGGALPASYMNFADWRQEAPALEALTAFVPPIPFTVATPDGSVRAVVVEASADLFEVAGVQPSVGRAPGPDENLPGGPPVAVVSHAFWESALGGRPLDSRPAVGVRQTVYDVVGVMPPGFDFPDAPDIWIPLDRQVPWNVRGNNVVEVIGRLAPGATVEEARLQLEAAHARIRDADPEVESVGVTVRTLLDQVAGDSRRALGLLLGASTVLLLVACTNVASTLLARGTGRLGELGVRAALGAGRARLVRQLFMESLAVAGAGGVGGVVTAYGLLLLTRAFDPSAVPRLAEVGVDGDVLAFTAAVALGTALLFGLLPAVRITRGDLAGLVRSGRTGHGRGARAAWNLMMAGEVALAVVLLVGGGLMIRSLSAILTRDGGFDSAGVVTARLGLPAGKYTTYEEAAVGLGRLVDEVAAAPGVDAAGITLLLDVPGNGSVAGPVGREDGTRLDQTVAYRVADRGFFETLGITTVAGRVFDERDAFDAPHAAVVNTTLAETLWPGEDALGRRFKTLGMDPWPDEWLTVVGVVVETLRWDREAGSSPAYYVSARQRPAFVMFFGGSLVARGPDRDALYAAVRDRVRAADPDIPVTLDALDQQIARSAGDRRLTAFVLGAFASLALLLAAVGVFGVVSYTVARRTREMGIRVALGASPGVVRAGVQREALGTVAVGAALGVVAALLLSGLLERLLFETSRLDPTSLVGAVALLGGAAWLASWFPARRGTRVDPAGVLREE